MSTQMLTYLFVGLSFALYIGIAIWSRASSTKDFYVAGGGVHPVVNGMATAADWMSAASFISMAGIISFVGRDGSVYLLGWTGGYVLLAFLLAPYLRKFGRFTVPDFIGERYYSRAARIVAVVCLIFNFIHLCCWSNARGRHCFFSLFRSRRQYRCHHRYGSGIHVRRTRRNERHHLHPGCTILRADFCLYGSRYLYLHNDYR